MNNFRIVLLGPISASVGGVPLHLGTARQSEMLAVLALRRDHPVSARQLVADVWGDHPPISATNLVHTYIGRLRTALRRALTSDRTGVQLRSRCPGYQLRIPGQELDLNRFGDELSRARAAWAAADRHATRALLSRALATWSGPHALAGAIGPLAEAERRRLDELRLEAVEDLLRVRLELGDSAGLVAELRSLVSLHPLRESLWTLLLTALDHADRRAEALDAFGQARTELVERLGVEPGPEMQTLYRHLLSGEPSRIWSAHANPRLYLPAAG
jgi:DNA-binding SARP family transcriptional activator